MLLRVQVSEVVTSGADGLMIECGETIGERENIISAQETTTC